MASSFCQLKTKERKPNTLPSSMPLFYLALLQLPQPTAHQDISAGGDSYFFHECWVWKLEEMSFSTLKPSCPLSQRTWDQ
jgi:hypothetical protein